MTREQLDYERRESARRRRERFAPVMRRVLEREAAQRAEDERKRRGSWPYTRGVRP